MYFDSSKLCLPSSILFQQLLLKLESQACYNTVALFICCKNNDSKSVVQEPRPEAQCCLSAVKGNENKGLHFEENSEEKYERTHICLTMKTMDIKFFVLHFIKNNLEENHHLWTRDISPENIGSFRSLTNAVCNRLALQL